MDVTLDELRRAEALAEELHSVMGTLVEKSKDYDITRTLKRSEAELMDLRHNLSMVRRLMGG